MPKLQRRGTVLCALLLLLLLLVCWAAGARWPVLLR
jgi:hypothetical protein